MVLLPPECPPKFYNTAGSGCSHTASAKLYIVAAANLPWHVALIEAIWYMLKYM